MVLTQISRKLVERHLFPSFHSYLVAGLELAVLVALLLHRVIGQMREFAFCVLQAELLAARSDVTLLIPVRFHLVVDARH